MVGERKIGMGMERKVVKDDGQEGERRVEGRRCYGREDGGRRLWRGYWWRECW